MSKCYKCEKDTIEHNMYIFEEEDGWRILICSKCMKDIKRSIYG